MTAPAPDARLYQQYNIIARIDGFCVAVEDGRALLVDGHSLPHPVMDPQASDALLVAARLIEHMRERWVKWGDGQPEAGAGGESEHA